MKGILAGILIMTVWSTYGQNIIGTWQVMKESNCLGEEFSDPSETEEELLESMSSLARTPKTIRFNDDNSGEENWRSKGKKRASAKQKFLFRYSDGSLYLLDKKSRLIMDTFIIEEITASSMIMFNKDRSCERVEMTRIN